MAQLFEFGHKENIPGNNEDSDYSANNCVERIKGLSKLYTPQEDGDSHVRDIADVLCEAGKITPEQLEHLRQQQNSDAATDAATWLLNNGLAGSDDILTAKAELYGLEFRHITPQNVEKQAFEKLEVDFIKTNSVCPIAIEHDTLLVATSEPANLFAIEDVKRRTQMDVRAVACSAADIAAVCDLFEADKMDYKLDDIISDMTEVEIVQDQQEELEDLEKMAGQSPVIKFVNYLNASDIQRKRPDELI